MIILKVKKPGLIVEIPGLPSCRTPVEIDITKYDIRPIVTFLKKSGITDYEIISTDEERSISRNKPALKTKKITNQEVTNSKEIDKRFSNLENMLSMIITQNQRNNNFKEEQINNKLNKLEKLISQKSSTNKNIVKKEPNVEEFDSFIPEISTDDMKINTGEFKVIKQESNFDDSADILSSLINSKKEVIE